MFAYFVHSRLSKKSRIVFVVPRSMKAESVFGGANLVANLTNVTGTVDMLRLYVILQALSVLALIVTPKALE